MSEEGQGPREAGAEATTERVAAILAADAVGYTRLMADDEKGTLAGARSRQGGVPRACGGQQGLGGGYRRLTVRSVPLRA